jgi:hypothetical protein
MAGIWLTKRVLIVVRTYPTPAKSTIEASCTAAISHDGQWIRMFPVPARLMDQDKRFAKWQWIDVSLLKAPSDTRPKSYKINPIPSSSAIQSGHKTAGELDATSLSR